MSLPASPDGRWDGARVGVLGCARSGVAAARALVARGASVVVLDGADTAAVRARAAAVRGARAILGRENAGDVDGLDLLVRSPGVPRMAAWLRAGRTVWSEIELAFQLGVRPAVAITGTNGKTTTVEMTTTALNAAGIAARAAGNIGEPLVACTRDDAVIVAEVSSFQLEDTVTFRAPVGVLLNLAPDHLDRYDGNTDEYYDAKARLFAFQTESDLALHHDDPDCARVAKGIAHALPFSSDALPPGGAGVEDGWIVVPQGRVVRIDRLQSPSRPFRADAVAACAAACALGADPALVGEGLAGFAPRANRVEFVERIDGVTYINDSKATSPHATLAALSELRDVVLIAGGQSKLPDLLALRAGAKSLRAVVAIGAARADVVAAFAGLSIPVDEARSLPDAVRAARTLARPGDTVLLSPACASYDMFESYEHRGQVFRDAVHELRGERT